MKDTPPFAKAGVLQTWFLAKQEFEAYHSRNYNFSSSLEP